MLTTEISRLSSKVAPATKDTAHKVAGVGKDIYDRSPSLIRKYPRLSVGLAGAGGAGAITGGFMGLEAISPLIPGDFNFAFGTHTPKGNEWKPWNPNTQQFEKEKEDYNWVKYVAIGGVAIAAIGVLGYLVKNLNTTVELVTPKK
ncbi:MAG: hypothetical protein WCR85_00235 [Sphaerochaeta sp.]